MPNFSQSLARYSQAVANRKTRREIKKQQEEAEAARRAASNARSNNGLISTLGGAAAAIGVGAYGGWNPATMAMAYQAGSALAGGLNRTVKPYNEQELAGMPYTQPSGWETLNQVAPSVMSAYGAYQQNQAKLQQDEYSNSINNILNLTKIGDLNPAATTEMIGKLNEQHTAKYELDSPPGYMMDVSTLDSLGTGEKGWSTQKASFASDIKGGIERGDVAAIEALKDSNMWQYHKGVSYEEAIRQAQTNKAALATKASDAKLDRANQQAIMANRIMESFDELPETYFRGEDGFASFKEDFLARQDVAAMVQSDPTFVNRIKGAYNQKRFELNKPMYEETMKAALTSLREDKGVKINYESFRNLAVKQLGHSEDVAKMLYENAVAGGIGDRTEAFYEDVNKLKLTKIDLFGEETPRDANTLEREIRYMGEIQGISPKAINFAVDRMRNATRGPEDPAQYNQQGPPNSNVNMAPELPPYVPESFSLGEGGSNYSIDNATTSTEDKNTYVGDTVLKYNQANKAELKGWHDLQKGGIVHAPESVQTQGNGQLENQPVSPIAVDSNRKPKDVTVAEPPAAESADIVTKRHDQLEELHRRLYRGYNAYFPEEKPAPSTNTGLDLNDVKDPVLAPGDQQPPGKGIFDMPTQWKAALAEARRRGDAEAVKALIRRGREMGLGGQSGERDIADLLKVIKTYNNDPNVIRNQKAGGRFSQSVDKYLQSRGK